MPAAAWRDAGPGSSMMPARRRRLSGTLPAVSSGTLLASPSPWSRAPARSRGGPARIAEGVRTGAGDDEHDREHPFDGQAGLPGRRAMARGRDGAAGPAPGCRRPGSACGVSGPVGSCRSSGPHRSVITGMLPKPPTSTTAHGRHDDHGAASTDAGFNIGRDIYSRILTCHWSCPCPCP